MSSIEFIQRKNIHHSSSDGNAFELSNFYQPAVRRIGFSANMNTERKPHLFLLFDTLLSRYWLNRFGL